MASRKKLKPKQMVLVAWLDSNTQHGWDSEDSHNAGPASCHHVGFVLADTPDYIRLAFGVSDQENVQASIAIPRPCIVAVKPLREEGGAQ